MQVHLPLVLSLSHLEKNNHRGNGKSFFIFSSHLGECCDTYFGYCHVGDALGA